ncbi:MAG: hypothetical protein UX75_C0036G0023 [Candidatus Moranbacteria bacterium GW2011_GWE2_47_10]|nr:MAG: hypothetical protein UX75_C0036G0023 [Candidatus Moranbacteria bacterium GW2011_GWE2_47_10]
MYYKDITFCPFLECKNVQCERMLTDEVKAAARLWWGKDNPPICCYASTPRCFECKDE